MKPPRVDVWILLVAILLAVAMLLTLLFGQKTGRHGYGWLAPGSTVTVQGAPFRTGSPLCTQE